MGKRRDRRQQQVSSRRVKLDLSADEVLPPSEIPGSLEVLDSALGEEVKAGAKNQEAATDNPLSLLGQYSDDEADEENDRGAGSLEDIDDEARKDSLKYQDEKDIAQSAGTGKVSLEEDQSTGTRDIDSIEQEPVDFLISDTKVQDAAVENEWQPVLDEGSGEYYYWNVRTGETTWVKPSEGENIQKVESSSIQELDFDSSLGRNPKQCQDVIHVQNDQRDSAAGDKSPACESNNSQHEGKAITCLESLQSDLDNSNARLVSSENNLAGAAAEKPEGVQDSTSTVGLLQGRVDHEGGELKGEEGKKDEEESVQARKDDGEDLNFEVTTDMQGTSGKDPQQIEAGMASRSSLTNTFMEGTDIGQVSPGDAQIAPMCTRHSMLTKEAQKTIEEKMASLVERGEFLHHRLNLLARESSEGISRHFLMASQTEARLTDWKAFCALGFVPDACLSFIQEELTQLELILAGEEANELEKRKLVESASPVEASHSIRPEIKNSGWPLNLPNHQQDKGTMPDSWRQGWTTEAPGKDDEVEEGEIRTSYTEVYPAYVAVSEDTTAVNTTEVSKGTGTEDVDMDVDMEVDEVEAEPAVPGMSSSVPASDIPAPYSYPSALPGLNDMSTLAPLDPGFVGEPTHYFHPGISGYSWAPPLPPDDEWAPPPPGESEPAPPPPPDEPPPLPPLSPEVGETYSMPSEVPLQYYVPEYTVENNPLSQCVPAADYHSVIDSSMYGAYLEGGVYSNCSQPIEALEIELLYGVAPGSTQALNGWTVLAPTASVLVNPVSSEASVKASAYVLPVSTAISTTAESTTIGASLETKKQAKGKTKKRTHAVAAAPMLNKKVSSLVNKWKQAKEELHGVEDEDEDEDKALYDVEALEKKRQKEIEEWRRQQIASGEALDNANFQPLGTSDWRERVKRARKADLKEGKEGVTGSVVSSSIVEGQNVESLKPQKPTMADLSKGLPPGWQAYWDEASGEVYYGNLSTQETTWDRPVT